MFKHSEKNLHLFCCKIKPAKSESSLLHQAFRSFQKKITTAARLLLSIDLWNKFQFSDTKIVAGMFLENHARASTLLMIQHYYKTNVSFLRIFIMWVIIKLFFNHLWRRLQSLFLTQTEMMIKEHGTE